MKRRICVRSMMLGAVIMLIGLAVGAIVSPPLGAQRNGVFDEITCRSLNVVDEKGAATIYFGNIVSEDLFLGGDHLAVKDVSVGHGVVVMDASTGDQAIIVGSYSHKGFPESAITVWDRGGTAAADNSKWKKAFEVYSGLNNVLKVYDKDPYFPKKTLDTGIGFYTGYDNQAELTRFLPHAEILSTRKD